MIIGGKPFPIPSQMQRAGGISAYSVVLFALENMPPGAFQSPKAVANSSCCLLLAKTAKDLSLSFINGEVGQYIRLGLEPKSFNFNFYSISMSPLYANFTWV